MTECGGVGGRGTGWAGWQEMGMGGCELLVGGEKDRGKGIGGDGRARRRGKQAEWWQGGDWSVADVRVGSFEQVGNLEQVGRLSWCAGPWDTVYQL